MDLKAKLLAHVASGQNGKKIETHGSHSKRLPEMSQRKPMDRSLTYPEQKILERLRKKGGSPQLRRKFLQRLAIALHTYGSSAPRTEYLIEKAADRIGVNTNIAVFPALILLSFISEDGDPERQETHLLTVQSDLDADKLGQADELANEVGLEGHEVLIAYWRLKAIATSKMRFNTPTRLISFAVLSGTASLLFFGGNLWDGLFSLVLGLLVGLLDLLAAEHLVVAQLVEFVTAVIVSFVARVLSVALAEQDLCFFAMALSSLVWLLPGLSLTIGVSELVAQSSLSGSAKIMAALFSALQLGFGLAIGEKLVWWNKSKIPNTCPGANPNPWLNLVWWAGYTVASNVLLNARWKQWPGMVFVSLAGWAVSYFTEFLGDASSVLSAFVIGVTGTVYSHFTGDLPLAMKTSGILLLVPGGVGVKGVTAIMDQDVLSGMGFVFDMMVVGLSITIGLLLSKIVLPAGLFGPLKQVANTKNSLARQLEAEEQEIQEHSDDEEEHMAI
eukprot:jgi/Mesen1/7363/ME000381S06598